MIRCVKRSRSKGKETVAAEAWGAVLDVGMGQRSRFFKILQKFGLTPGDLRALAVLEPDEPRPIGLLAQAWECDASNATWMVDRLEERGLVERRLVPTDRRVKMIALTPLGVKTKEEVFERLHEPPPEFLALDRAVLEQLRDALSRLPPSLRAAGAHSSLGTPTR